MFDARAKIARFDPGLRDAIRAEEQRQEAHIELIASENYTSVRVMAAQGSVLTKWMCHVLDNMDDEGVAHRVRGQVRAPCEQLPVYHRLDQQPMNQEVRHGS